MAGAVDRFLAVAGEVEVRRFDASTRTAADAAAAIGVEVGQIVKSLVWMADEVPLLALVPGDRRLDSERLAAAVGAHEVRPATADEARAAAGFSIGGVPPFGHPRALATVLDAALERFSEVWAAAGTPRDVFRTAPGELVERARAEVAPLSGPAG